MDADEFKRLIELNVNVSEGDNINEIARLMIDSIVKYIDIVAPRKLIVIKNKWQGKQWFSENIYKFINQRDIAHKAARMSNSRKDWDLFNN